VERYDRRAAPSNHAHSEEKKMIEYMGFIKQNPEWKTATCVVVNSPAKVKPALAWCADYESEFTFHTSQLGVFWWFQNSHDALMFSLRWSHVKV